MIVVGAGISGAAMAQFVAKMGKKVLVLEERERVGGAIHSFAYDGISIDMGAHTAYNSYTTLLKLIEVAGIEDAVKERVKQKYFFLEKNKFKKLTSKLHKISLLLNIYKVLKIKKSDFTVKEYYSKLLGKKNYRDFARHFFKAVLSQNPDDFPADKILKIRKNKNKAYPKSMTFENGMQAIIDGFLKDANITVVENSPVTKIGRNGNGYVVESKDNRFVCENIALALHADKAEKICKEVLPHLSESLKKIPYKEISSSGIVLNKEKCKIPLFSGVLTQTDEFNSIVSRDIYPHDKYRGFTIHSEDRITEDRLKEKLCEAISVNVEDVSTCCFRINRLPVLQKNHSDVVSDIEAELLRNDGVYIVGNYFLGLSMEDCICRAEQEAQRYINDN